MSSNIKKHIVICITLIAMSLLCSLSHAIEHHSNSDKEKEITRQWFAQHQSNAETTPLLKAILSFHYQPQANLEAYLNGEPENRNKKIIISLMALQCAENSHLSYCFGSMLEDKLVKLDTDNLFSYLLLFNHYIAVGGFDDALQTLKKGLNTIEVNDYYFDKVMHLRSELKNMGIYGKEANLLAEDFSGNGLDKIYIHIMPTCEEHSKTSSEWASTCLTLSDKLEKGSTFLSNVVGSALRRDVLKAISADETKINEAIARRKFYNTFREDAWLKQPGWVDPAKKPDSYYSNALKFGEFRAIQIMLDEANPASNE